MPDRRAYAVPLVRMYARVVPHHHRRVAPLTAAVGEPRPVWCRSESGDDVRLLHLVSSGFRARQQEKKGEDARLISRRTTPLAARAQI